MEMSSYFVPTPDSQARLSPLPDVVDPGSSHSDVTYDSIRSIPLHSETTNNGFSNGHYDFGTLTSNSSTYAKYKDIPPQTNAQPGNSTNQSRRICSQRRLLIGAVILIMILLGGLATTTSLLLLPKEQRSHADENNNSTDTTSIYKTSPPTLTSTTFGTALNTTSSTTTTTEPLTTTSTTTTTTESLTTTSSTTTNSRPLTTTSSSTTTTEPLTTTSSTTITTNALTTLSTTENCIADRKCHSCTSHSNRCPANGNMAGTDHGQLMACPCDTACFSEIRPFNGVHRGCTKEFPEWYKKSRLNMTCQTIGESFLCFCLGDRCNTHNMTVFPEYQGN